jgi:hypothetical protein
LFKRQAINKRRGKQLHSKLTSRPGATTLFHHCEPKQTTEKLLFLGVLLYVDGIMNDFLSHVRFFIISAKLFNRDVKRNNDFNYLVHKETKDEIGKIHAD